MSFAGNALDLIRSVFHRDTTLPVGPSYFDSINSNAISYSNVTLGPQNGYNEYMSDSVKLDQDLMSRYADYEDMDDFPELHAALNLFSDDATVQDVLTGRSMWVESDDTAVEETLEDMLTVNLKAEESLWEITRSLCKYGNEFNEIFVVDGVGVVRLNHIPPPSIRRIEDVNGILYGFLHDPTMTFRMDTKTFLDRLRTKSTTELSPIPYDATYQDLMQVYEPWECVHFRLRGKARRDLYGYSATEAARWAWKRLTMMEDAMVLYKLTRSPQRYAYYVDVGDVPPNQARGFVNRIKNEFKKTKFIDPNCLTGDTLIPCLDGKHKTIKELAEGAVGERFQVFSYDLQKGKVVVGDAHSPVLSAKSVPIYRVRLDSGAVVRCTADHPFLMRDGEYKQASELCKGDSLMPFYLNEMRSDGYLAFRDIDASKSKHVHQMVAEEFLDKDYRSKGFHAHHINEDKWDNRPENLVLVTAGEHLRTHDHFKSGARTEGYKNKVKSDPKFRAEIYSRIKKWRDENPGWEKFGVEGRLRKRKENEIIDNEIYDQIMNFIDQILLEAPDATAQQICERLNETEEAITLWQNLSETRTEEFKSISITYILNKRGIEGLGGYKMQLFGAVKRKLVYTGQHKKDPSQLVRPKLRKRDERLWTRIMELSESIVVCDPLVNADGLCNELNANDEFLSCWRELSETRVDFIKPSNVSYMFKRNGFKGFAGFKIAKVGENKRRANWRNRNVKEPNNHKVVCVEFAGYEDVYDLTVDKYHNFALSCGVFVHNTGKPNFRYNPLSQDEDIFIPVRKGKRSTEIEVLAGPEGQQIEDVEYFLNKIFASLSIPKTYLGADETIGRANLAQMDVRYARSVMRIQRVMKNGFQHIARVDLAAKNIDPDRVDFDMHMVIPSGVFELAQMEVQTAKLDLADRYTNLNFSEYYIWSEILGLSDEDINKIQQQRADAPTSDLDGEESEKVKELMPKAVDKARDRLPAKAKELTPKILGEIEKNQTKFARRINELKNLTHEIRSALNRTKYFNGRKAG